MNGFINVNKCEGMTSFQVVSLIKKKSKSKKVGHLGTLDPAATGVLPIAVGKATKLFDLFLEKKKTYRAYFYFGKETDTLDSYGKIINTSNKIINENDIKENLKNFVGEILQLPPKFSSKSINGKRAYELARGNTEFELKPKKIVVDKFELIDKINDNLFLFEIECGAGCYIRSLCRDLAYSLNTVGYMPLLIRTQSGPFNISNSIDVKTLHSIDNLDEYIIPIEKVLNYKSIYLNDKEYKKVANGITINYSELNGKYLLFDSLNNFFALGVIEDNKLKMEIYFGD